MFGLDDIGEGTIFGDSSYKESKVYCGNCDEWFGSNRVKEEDEFYKCPVCKQLNIFKPVNYYWRHVKEPLMNGQEIAEEFDCTRMNINNTLVKSMEKIYVYLRKKTKKSPYEVACKMVYLLGINERGTKEIQNFFKMFPPKIREQIHEDGKQKLENERREKAQAMH